MSILPRLVTLVAVSGLLLLLFGPVVDHHFAERQLPHRHIYLNQIALDHVHPFELSHTHLHEAGDPDTSSSLSGRKAPDDIMYLTSDDGMGQAVAQFTPPPAHLTTSFLDLVDHRFAFGAPGGGSFPQGAFIVSPRRPPRATSFSLP